MRWSNLAGFLIWPPHTITHMLPYLEDMCIKGTAALCFITPPPGVDRLRGCPVALQACIICNVSPGL